LYSYYIVLLLFMMGESDYWFILYMVGIWLAD